MKAFAWLIIFIVAAFFFVPMIYTSAVNIFSDLFADGGWIFFLIFGSIMVLFIAVFVPYDDDKE